MQHDDFPTIRIQHLGSFIVLARQEKARKRNGK